MLALAGAVGAPASAATGEGADDGSLIYSFVDAGGVVHYTNVPHDRRYRVVAGERRDRTDGPEGTRRAGAKQRSAIGVAASRGAGASRAGRIAWLPGRSSAFDEHIRVAARKYGLAPQLLKAVMAAESNFNPAAISGKGATGLMQLMPETARDMYVYDILDPTQNIEGGARYLRQLLDWFGTDLERVLAAYNAGPERVRRSGGAVPAIPETRAYVRKVLGLYEAYLKVE